MPVAGFEHLYSISNYGRARSEARVALRTDGFGYRVRQRILKPGYAGSGYQTIVLMETCGAGRKQVTIHRMVAIAFLGPVPEGREVCHKDSDKANNRADNFYYGTHSDNVRDNYRRGVNHFSSAKTACKRGHGFNGANLTILGNGDRDCRACRATHWRSYVLRKEYGVRWTESEFQAESDAAYAAIMDRPAQTPPFVEAP